MPSTASCKSSWHPEEAKKTLSADEEEKVWFKKIHNNKKNIKWAVKCLSGARCYRCRPHLWPPKEKKKHLRAPPQKNSGSRRASGYNWPQSNQPLLPHAVIGFRAINKAAVINFKQAPACPRHCLSTQFICRVSHSSGGAERRGTAALNNAKHPMFTCDTWSREPLQRYLKLTEWEKRKMWRWGMSGAELL